jgi:predicted small secreted protein
MRKLFLALALAGPLLAACNTVQGFGKDMSKVGDKIESTAEKAKK